MNLNATLWLGAAPNRIGGLDSTGPASIVETQREAVNPGGGFAAVLRDAGLRNTGEPAAAPASVPGASRSPGDLDVDAVEPGATDAEFLSPGVGVQDSPATVEQQALLRQLGLAPQYPIQSSISPPVTSAVAGTLQPEDLSAVVPLPPVASTAGGPMPAAGLEANRPLPADEAALLRQPLPVDDRPLTDGGARTVPPLNQPAPNAEINLTAQQREWQASVRPPPVTMTSPTVPQPGQAAPNSLNGSIKFSETGSITASVSAALSAQTGTAGRMPIADGFAQSLAAPGPGGLLPEAMRAATTEFGSHSLNANGGSAIGAETRSADLAMERIGATALPGQILRGDSDPALFRPDTALAPIPASISTSWRALGLSTQPGTQLGAQPASLSGIRSAQSLAGIAGASPMPAEAQIEALGVIDAELSVDAEADIAGTTAELRAADSRRGPGTASAVTLAMDMGDPANNAERLAQQIQQSLIKGAQTLRLSLRPQALGGLELNLTQSASGELNVQIAAQSAQTRDLIDFHLPRLRASLEEAGVRLGDVNVQVATDDRAGQQPADRQQSAGRHSAESAGGNIGRASTLTTAASDPESPQTAAVAYDPSRIDAFV